jgi:hypothetical protein
MTWWIPLIFLVGLGVSVLGLIPSIAASLEKGFPTLGAAIFAVMTVFFGWAVAHWLAWPYLLRPRIVPYFARALGEYGGGTTAAFRRGRGLYREIDALERLAAALGSKPLSAFGFAYDYYQQEARWHAASEGLRTVEALRQGSGDRQRTAPDVREDLEALASVLRVAADQEVDFSLVLRLHAKDSLRDALTLEVRRGSFW